MLLSVSQVVALYSLTVMCPQCLCVLSLHLVTKINSKYVLLPPPPPPPTAPPPAHY